jgi:predicted O-methyltransferase YrrM
VGSADLLRSVQQVRAELAHTGPDWVRSEGDFARVALPDAEADILRDLLIEQKAAAVIEIGLAYGVSALAIAEALLAQRTRRGPYLIIDPFLDQQFNDVGWNAIERAGIAEFCWLLRERSQLALPRLLAEGLVADAAFVDGSHIFHNVFVDLYYLQEIIRPGGLIILDDCDWPSVGTAVSYFERNAGWTRESVRAQTRLTAYRLPDPRFEPTFESFVQFGDS